jgi:adenine-specific DNA-methyltransferase
MAQRQRKGAGGADRPARRRSGRQAAAGEAAQDYRHEAKRKNNPEAGLVTYERVAEGPPPKQYEYDPHLDPQLTWAGKAEHTSFEVDTVSLHIHERVSTHAIVRAIQRQPKQFSLFADPQLPLAEAVEFYQHDVDWANRLVLGDSLVVMNSLLERELMAGKVQMIYLDPPYGVAYNSNFQPRIDRRDVKDGDDGSLTREPEMIKAYRDTWRLGIHSYLTYLRDRLLLCRELLHDSGSAFVQIGDENLHRVRAVMDEVFGAENFCAVITFRKTGGFSAELLDLVSDYLVWYAKDKQNVKYRQLLVPKESQAGLGEQYQHCEFPDGTRRRMTPEERANPDLVPDGARIFEPTSLISAGRTEEGSMPFEFSGRTFEPPGNAHWKTSREGLRRLAATGRIVVQGNTPRYVRYLDDFPSLGITNVWADTMGQRDMLYVVQTNTRIVERCLLMTTDPGDLVLDPTCGSGTTAYVAEQWGRRWITIDTSRVALALARQRLLTASFPYYRLAHPEQGVKGGFVYQTVPHITLKSIAQNPELDPDRVEARRQRIRKENPKAKPEEVERLLRQENEAIIRGSADQETLYDRPEVERGKVRVSGPFTVEAIPVAVAEEPTESPIPALEADARGDDIARRGAGGPISDPAGDHVATMLDLLRASGVTFPGGKRMKLENLRPIASGGALHAEAEVKQNGDAQRVAISFGPRHGPITAWQVDDAARPASRAGYDILIFAGFGFDAPAQEAIREVKLPGLTMHAANVCPDVLVGDLLKTTAGSQLFTVFGQPDVQVRRVDEAPKGRKRNGKGDAAPAGEGAKVEYVVELRGVDIYDPTTGEVHSAKGEEVAAWFLDTDYDGRTFCICQAFFPGGQNPWEKLQRALRGNIDPERFDEMRGTTSQPFQPGDHQRIAVKVIDFRGNEVVRVMGVQGQ